MQNATPPLLTPEQYKDRRESRRDWYGPLADDNVEHVLFRIRNLLANQYYTVVTYNTEHTWVMPEVRVSQFIMPFRTTSGVDTDGFRLTRIGEVLPNYSNDSDDERLSDMCGISIHDSYGSYGISSHHATERDAHDDLRSDRREWVTELVIKGGLSPEEDQCGSRDQIQISQYNLTSPRQRLHWVFAPERHWERG